MPILNEDMLNAENILIAMLADSNKHNRQRAVERILHCRLTASTNNTVRHFKVRNIDFNASDWIDMIDWEESHELPATKMLSTQQIFTLLTHHTFSSIPINNLLNAA